MNRLAHLVVAGLLMVSQHYAHAQKVPMFQTPLFFEDAVGNKDTLIIGYDTLSKDDRIYPEFGEVWIGTPMDSVFEVRAFHFDDFSQKMSKKIIAGCEKGGGCYNTLGPKIVVSAKYPPIKIRYDSTQFGIGSCRENAIISPDWLMFFIEFWWETDLYFCMAPTSVITYSLNFQGQKFEVETDVVGKGKVKLPGLFCVLWLWGPCPKLLPASDAPKTPPLPLTILPNPAAERAEVQFESGRPARVILGIFDARGTLLQVHEVTASPGLNKAELDLKGLPAGSYVVRATDGRAAGSAVLVKY